jgi:hypothetical protein
MRKSLYLALVFCGALLLILTPAQTRADSVTGDTTVVLDSSTVTTLTGLGLSLSPLGQASFDATTLTLMFPITSGSLSATGDVFKHDGSGFSLATGSDSITFRNLSLNTATETLSGNVHFGNTQMNGVTLFDIGSGGVLALSAQAAADLSSAFGVSDFTGTTFGTVSVNIPLGGGTGDPSGSGTPTSTPEPSVFGLLASSALAIGGMAFLRSRNRAQLRTQFGQA